VLQGRWRFEGTEVAIADIRRDFEIGDGPLMEPYRRRGISEDDIQAALSFDFPAIRNGRVEVDQSFITVHCVCGEDTRQTIAWPEMTVRCVCSRLWKVAVAVDRLSADEPAFETNGNAEADNGSSDPRQQPPQDAENGGGSRT
jgi:hypothetical protein